MEAIREIQTVKEGHVHVLLPRQFWGQQVEIIVLSASQQEPRASQKKSLRGCLHHYANPTLITREEDAWQEAMGEKHAHY